MAGKTTYLSAFATTLYLAHLGMGVLREEGVFELLNKENIHESIIDAVD